MKKVTGLGGIFFKSEDPAAMREWYAEHLGVFVPNKYGGLFEWRDKDNPEEMGHTVWSPFGKRTEYFEPSNQPFMINYRVADLDALLEELKAQGVTIVGETMVETYGKFAWILDLEGNKVELWEPNDPEFRKINDLK